MGTTATAQNRYRSLLLTGGVLASLLYVAMNALIPAGWPGYDIASQTISELSALGAPTRPAWLAAAAAYTLLMTGFGCGIWSSARGDHRLKTAGALICIYSVLGLFWPPMHQRHVLAAGGGSMTDVLHLIWSAVTVFFMTAAIVYCAAVIGGRFKAFSAATIGLMAMFGTLTGLDADRITRNLPTPLLGIWERVMIGAFLLWIVVLAVILLRHDGSGGIPHRMRKITQRS